MKKFLLIIILFTSGISLFGQSYFIEGSQKNISQNMQFNGEPVYIPVQCYIDNASGDFTSFSLQIDNLPKYQFYFSDDKFDPSFSDTIIEPGMYVLYPDLPPDKDSVTIKIELKPIE